MKTRSTVFITRTAMLLALTVVFQMAGRLLPANSNFIVGPLVNACLAISAVFAGLWGGIVISVLSPFTSLVNNHAPIAAALLPFAPFIAAGNAVYVTIFKLSYRKSKAAGIIAGSTAKSAFLYGSVLLFLRLFNFPKFSKTLLFLFGWPQLVTALIGGFIALAVVKAAGKAIDMDTD